MAPVAADTVPVPATIPYWIYLLATALFVLGLCIILANSFVMVFYKKRLKEIVPLMYIMMAVCDSVTGIVVLGHAVIFVNHGIVLSQLIQDKNKELYFLYKADVFTTSVYIILQSCTRASVFYNTVLTVVRTINIARPIYLIRKNIVIVIAILYPILWVTACIIDVVEANNSWYNGTSITGMIFEVLPGNPWSISFELTVVLVMVIPLFLPTILALVSALIQIYSLLKPSIISPPSVRERSMTVTIIMLTMLCLVCNIPYTVFFFLYIWGMDFYSYRLSHLYILSTVLPFIQALLNPVILISRGAALRQFAFKVVTGAFKKRNTADGVETEMMMISDEAHVGTQRI